jgi:hypothetical protein
MAHTCALPTGRHGAAPAAGDEARQAVKSIPSSAPAYPYRGAGAAMVLAMGATGVGGGAAIIDGIPGSAGICLESRDPFKPKCGDEQAPLRE